VVAIEGRVVGGLVLLSVDGGTQQARGFIGWGGVQWSVFAVADSSCD
jgi:hypothetical protein